MPLPHDPGPHWGEVGIHGLHRQREWDVLRTVEAAGLVGDELWFVGLADGRTIVEEGGDDPGPLAAAVGVEPPYRAHGVKRGEGVWVVAASRIEVVELSDDPGGIALELAWNGAERTVRIDGTPTLAGIPELERLGASRHSTFVVTATRLDATLWDVAVAPL